MAIPETNSVNTQRADPRTGAVLQEIASLANTASAILESGELNDEAAAGLRLVLHIGFLADSAIKINGGIQNRGGAVDWLAPYLVEDEVEVSHG